MSKVGQKERIIQNRIVKLFQLKLGYFYLGNWEKREENNNVKEKFYNNQLIDNAIKNWLKY